MSKLQDRVFGSIASGIIKRPGTTALVVGILAIVSAIAAKQFLYINTNQLDLISQDLRAVKDVKRVTDMVGGVGHLIIALRGNDEQALKDVSDDLAAILKADTKNVRNVNYKLPVDWVKERAALYMKTDDLTELHRRAMLFLKDRMKRASPFFMEIVPTKPVELEYKDLVEKYMRIGKKSIVDDYWISADRKMIIMPVKPNWSTEKLADTGRFLEELRATLADYSKTNKHGYRMVEDYKGEPDADGRVVQFGFTGGYPATYYDSVDIERSLAPVSLWALLGVVLVMIAFFGRGIGSVGFVMTGLVAGVAMSFGFAVVSLGGELNMITSILGGILMGTGIDFGIFLIYRLREEFSRTNDATEAVRATIVHAGPASFASAAGVGAAFFSLLFSDFRGFSQFGLLAGTGVIIIGFTMYAWIPATFLLLEKRYPQLIRSMLGSGAASLKNAADTRSIPKPKVLLAVAGGIVLMLAVFAPSAVFDYDTRALYAEGAPTLRLQDELNRRFELSSDPAAIYTPDFAEARKVFDAFQANPEKYKTVDQLVSIYSFIPPATQQEANAKILEEWKAEVSEIDPAVLPAEYQGKWADALKMLSARPFALADVPDIYTNQFKHQKTTKEENWGTLTFLYPKVDVWDGKQLINFAESVENIPVEGGKTYNTAGSAVVMATLAKIVLNDVRVFILITLILLVIILVIDTGGFRTALVAMVPLLAGLAVMLGFMSLFDIHMNFMNIVVFPIVLGFGISQGVYLIHRYNEGTPPRAALVSVGTAVACSTLTALVGWAALLAAAHRGLKTMGVLACVGMTSILVVSFTVMPAILQLMYDRRQKQLAAQPKTEVTGA